MLKANDEPTWQLERQRERSGCWHFMSRTVAT